MDKTHNFEFERNVLKAAYFSNSGAIKIPDRSIPPVILQASVGPSQARQSERVLVISAAVTLAASLLETPRFSDYEAYPVVFLYRHALELSLKHVIYGGVELAAFRRIDDINEQLKNSHDLVALSRIAGNVLPLLFPKDEMVSGLNSSMAAICKDWSQIDPRSDAYRYPIDTKGYPSTKKHQVVNLRALSTHMAAVLEDLDTIHFGLNLETYKAQELYEALEQFVPSGHAP